MLTRRPITEAEWERYRDELKALYSEEDKSLGQIITLMKTKYSFCPSKSQYETAFKRWGFRKNLNLDEWKHVHHQTHKRKAENKETDVYLNGILIPAKRVKKELSRYFPPSFTRFPSPDPCIPAGLFFRTPEGTTVPEIPHELADHYTPAYQQSPAYQQPRSPALRDIVVQTPSDLATQTPPQLCHNFSPVYRQFIFSALLAPPYPPVQIDENLCVLRDLPEPEDLPWFQFHERLDRYVKPSENLVSSQLIPLPVHLWGLSELLQLFKALGSVECVLQAPSFPGKDLALQFSTQRLSQPINHSGLSEFLQYMVYLASNNMLDEEQIQHLFEWVCHPNNYSAIRAFFSLKMPTVDAFARYIFEIALQRSDVAFVRILLDVGVDPHLRMKDKKTSLEVALARGNIELTRILLDAGVGVNDLPSDWWVGAFKNRDPKEKFEMIQMMLDKGADIKTWRRTIREDDCCTEGTALDLAASAGDVELVKLLLEAGAHVNALPEYPEDSDRIVDKYDAAAEGIQPGLYYIIERTALIELASGYENHHSSELAQLLLDKGVEVNVRSRGPWGGKYGKATALQRAARRGHISVVEVLLGEGAKLYFPDSRFNALRGVVSRGLVRVARKLLDAGADLSARNGRKTFLEYAVQSGNVKMVKTLLDKGSDILRPALASYRALGMAVWLGKVKIVQMLLEAGVGLNKLSDMWRSHSPLYLAAWCGNVKMVRMLLGKGANVNVEDGFSPLQAAALHGYDDIVHILLAAGAEVDYQVHHKRGSGGLSLWSRLTSYNLHRHVDCGYLGYRDSKRFDSEADTDSEADSMPDSEAMEDWESDFSSETSVSDEDCDGNGSDSGNNYIKHGSTALWMATMRGRVETVQMLLNAGANVNTSRASVLVCAELADHNNAALTSLLIAAGADVKTRHHFCQGGWTWPIVVAADRGNIELVRLSLDAGADINVVDWQGKTALLSAAENRHTEVFKLLLAAGADMHTPWPRSARLSGAPWDHVREPDITLTWILLQASKAGMVIGHRVGRFSKRATSTWATHALPKAVQSRNVEMIQLLIDIGADMNYSQDPLLAAVRTNDSSIIEFILGMGIDVNLSIAALFAASCRVDIRTLQLVIDAGANVNAIYHRKPETCSYCDKLCTVIRTPLTESISCQSGEWLSVLLNAGANPNVSRLPSEGWTALQKAAGAGDIIIVQMLQEKGADINAPAYSHGGRTALQAALIRGHTAIAQSLLQAGADVNAPAAPCGGITALQAAAIKGQLGIAIMLLRAGADPNAPPAERDGRTALQGAAEHGRLDMVQYLLRAGADIDDIPRAKKLAEDNGHHTIIEILKKSEVGVSGEEDIF